jgi:hypothetical protein
MTAQIGRFGLEGSPNYDGHEPERSEIDSCKEWIELYCKKRKTFNRNMSSYELKHIVEDYSEYHKERNYVSNGAFIQAATELGYEYKPCHSGSPNAYFKMDEVWSKLGRERRNF